MIFEAALVVVRVKPDSPAADAGLQPGYRLLSYNGRPLLSPSHLKALEENTLSLEQIVLVAEWEGQQSEILVPPGSLGVETRPELAEEILNAYTRGQQAFEEKQYADAARIWNEAAQSAAQSSPEQEHAVWLFLMAGMAWEMAAEWQTALSYYEAVHERLADGRDAASQVRAWVSTGRCLMNSVSLEASAQCYAQAQQVAERAGWLPWTANAIHTQGMIAFYTGALSQAERFYVRAFALREQFALGAPHYAPHMVESLNDQGMAAWKSGQLARALEYYGHALRIQESIARDTEQVAAILNNLGLVVYQRGDLDKAEEYHRRALSLWNRPPADLQKVAMSQGNLGAVAWARGDLDQAENLYNQALTLGTGLASNQPEVTSLLVECRISLGNIALKRDRLERARQWFQEALDILESFAPDSLDVAISLSGLASVEWKCGDLERAQARPNNAEAHDTQAHNHWNRAAAIFESIAPVSLDYADALMEMGKAALRRGRGEQAVAHLKKSLDIVEQQRASIVSPEARALLVAQHTAKYAALIHSYALLKNSEAAFFTLERARARSFLELLAERDLDFAADAPPELLQNRDQLDSNRAYAYEQLRQLSTTPANAEQVTQLRRTLSDLERQRAELTVRLCAASPRFAALQYPQPLSLKAAQELLTPGMLLLSYFVDEEQTSLSAVTADRADIYPLPLGRAALQEKMRTFRRALNPRLIGNEDGAEAVLLGRELYADLIAPAQALLYGAKRLLLCPDGPLSTLPFGALVTNSDEPPLYLGAQKPLHNALSMTLYAQAHQQQSLPARQKVRRVFALGDPHYAPATPGNAPAFERLQHTRQEVKFLGRLFGRHAVIRSGVHATKTAVLYDTGKVDIVHLACHGWFDARTPLSSGLALSPSKEPEEQTLTDGNGRLEAWEIFQKLRLRADLVVLSACWSGVGQEVRGEGLIGLTRAFQYAGTRSLVASLWAVNDASTSLFMRSFYEALKDGQNKDDALQQGVLKLLAHPVYRHPHYWSAFVLIGDRRNVAGPDELQVRQSQQGNKQAFDTLVLRYRKPIESLCKSMLFNNMAEAEQVAQDTFLKAWQKINTYQWEAPFSAWLTTIASRTALNMLRTKMGMGILRNLRLNEPGKKEDIEIPDPGPGVEETVIGSLFIEQFAEQWSETCSQLAAVAHPPWDALDYLIYALRYENLEENLEETLMTTRELALLLNKPESTIKDRIRLRILPVLHAAAKKLGLE